MICPSEVACEKCPLSEHRTVIVDGYGSQTAKLMIVGKAPLFDEDRVGRPFVGASGQDLRAELLANDFDPADAFITYSAKCRPPNNRDPKADEVEECRSWLVEELESVKPEVLLVLGATARIAVRGALVVSTHSPAHIVEALDPAAFLWKPNPAKRKAWKKQIALAVALAEGREIETGESVPWSCYANDKAVLAMLLSAGSSDGVAMRYPLLSLDTEYDTNGPDAHITPDLVSWSLGTASEALFVDGPRLDWLQEVWDWCDAGGILTGSNIIQADIPTCEKAGIVITDRAKYEHVRDCMIDAYVAREDVVGLKDLGKLYANMDVVKFTDVAPVRGKKEQRHRLQFSEVLADPKLRPAGIMYGAQDAILGVRVTEAIDPKLKDDQRERLAEIEYPLAHILGKMHRRGVLIDREPAKELRVYLAEIIERESEAAYKALGEVVPLVGGDRLAERLQALGLPITKHTKGGGWDTQAKYLRELQQGLIEREERIEAVAAVNCVINTRQAKKNWDFVNGLLEASEYDGRVHTTFRQAGSEVFGKETATEGPATGRLSSGNPNLQNIPSRDPNIARRIRKLFIPSPGYRWVCGDLNQIELRLFAHYTKAPVLLDAFRNNKKVHQMIADELGVSYETAKHQVVYPTLYGVAAERVALDLGMKKAMAAAFLTRFRDRIPEFLEWPEQARKELEKSGQIAVAGGWYCYYPEYFGPNPSAQAAAVREAANARLQGFAATVAKKMHVEADKMTEAWGGDLLLQVHDELDAELPEDCANDFAMAFASLGPMMEEYYEIEVPIILEVKVGLNWGETH